MGNRTIVKFAWLPTKMNNGGYIWLTNYYCLQSTTKDSGKWITNGREKIKMSFYGN